MSALKQSLTSAQRLSFETMKRQQWKQRFIQPIKHWHIAIGDKVKVISGEDEGRIGEVIRVLRDKNSVIVKNTKLSKRVAQPTHMKTGHYYHRESHIHISNVQLIDPNTNQPTRISYAYNDKGNRIRISKQTNTIIEKNTKKMNTVKARFYNPIVDTSANIVLNKTYIEPDYIELNKKLMSELSSMEQIELAFARMDV